MYTRWDDECLTDKPLLFEDDVIGSIAVEQMMRCLIKCSFYTSSQALSVTCEKTKNSSIVRRRQNRNEYENFLENPRCLSSDHAQRRCFGGHFAELDESCNRICPREHHRCKNESVIRFIINATTFCLARRYSCVMRTRFCTFCCHCVYQLLLCV